MIIHFDKGDVYQLVGGYSSQCYCENMFKARSFEPIPE